MRQNIQCKIINIKCIIFSDFIDFILYLITFSEDINGHDTVYVLINSYTCIDCAMCSLLIIYPEPSKIKTN